MKTERLPTRDVRENRSEREEKLGNASDTLPGKTLRDRALHLHETPLHEEGRQPKRFTDEPVIPNVLPALPASGKIWFRLNAPTADRVCVAGMFNDWNPSATPLSKHDDGQWRVQTELAPGEYEYRFVVDGLWQEDPHARHAVPNPFGSRNSVIHVA